MLHCRHLNADEFQYVANGSNIEIGNFLQDGAKHSFPVDSMQAGWPCTTTLFNATERNAEGLHRDVSRSAEEKLQNPCATLSSDS